MKKILVVDDEPAVLFALSEALTDKRRGWQVVTASDGKEAMRALQTEKIHFVVTDLRMPEVDGFELLAHLRRNHPSLPVILMTALGTAEISARLGADALECLGKPFDVEVLRQKIRDMLAQRVKGRVENISLSSFLQLLEIERKTCTLSVAAGGRQGQLYFRQGKLVGAETGEVDGQDAALEIVAWEHADIEISDVCPVNGPPLPGGLAYLLMEAMRLKDESDEAERTEEDELEAILDAPRPVPVAVETPEADPTDELRAILERGRSVDGAVATLLVETRTGSVVAAISSKLLDLEDAAGATADLARRKAEMEERMGLRESVEELLVTTSRSFYLMRPVDTGEKHFLLMILDRRKADLTAAQDELTAIAREMAVLVDV
jgi:DNA-binding response OmpR family regulator